MVCKLPRKVYFLKFCGDLSKKSKSIKSIYIYAYERPRHALSGNRIVFYGITCSFENICLKSKNSVTFLLSQDLGSCIYECKSSQYNISENPMVYRGLGHCS